MLDYEKMAWHNEKVIVHYSTKNLHFIFAMYHSRE